ncbi:FKBP-type peptidyl-prolyl cis-trans isomerase [Lysobacter sp. D1-1-M9]|uniref:FKBP-type peptidyl-prolyl cis-trans isomerase n=2 Tax=Novilysobacter TaxID=3382699 RepID=UPI002FCAB2DC
MKAFVRGIAVMLTTAAALIGASAIAQEKTALDNEKERVSYAIGMDVGSSIKPVGPDMDLAAFERGIRNAFDGGEPLLSEAEARETDQALRARVMARDGVTGSADAAAPLPSVSPDKVGYLVGGLMVGRSLLQIKDAIELSVLVQAVRAQLSGQQTLLTEEEMQSVLSDFSQQAQARAQAQAQAAAETNQAEGEAFLAKNKSVKGVFTTGSGLQYMVLRQGSGPMPTATDRVRVNYQGTLLDGTVFDSSYERGQPAEFALNQVIAGWTEGVAMMPVGAKYRFWVPGELGYGARGTPGGPIGPNATLVFDVELQAIL